MGPGTSTVATGDCTTVTTIPTGDGVSMDGIGRTVTGDTSTATTSTSTLISSSVTHTSTGITPGTSTVATGDGTTVTTRPTGDGVSMDGTGKTVTGDTSTHTTSTSTLIRCLVHLIEIGITPGTSTVNIGVGTTVSTRPTTVGVHTDGTGKAVTGGTSMVSTGDGPTVTTRPTGDGVSTDGTGRTVTGDTSTVTTSGSTQAVNSNAPIVILAVFAITMMNAHMMLTLKFHATENVDLKLTLMVVVFALAVHRASTRQTWTRTTVASASVTAPLVETLSTSNWKWDMTESMCTLYHPLTTTLSPRSNSRPVEVSSLMLHTIQSKTMDLKSALGHPSLLAFL